MPEYLPGIDNTPATYTKMLAHFIINHFISITSLLFNPGVFMIDYPIHHAIFSQTRKGM